MVEIDAGDLGPPFQSAPLLYTPPPGEQTLNLDMQCKGRATF